MGDNIARAGLLSAIVCRCRCWCCRIPRDGVRVCHYCCRDDDAGCARMQSWQADVMRVQQENGRKGKTFW